MEQMKVWSTRGLAPSRALSFWNEAVSSAFLRVRTESRHSPQPFQAQLQSLSRGNLSVNRLHAQSYRVVCNTNDSHHDWLFINLHEHGRCRLRQLGREHWASPGDISLNLGNTPFDFEFDDQVAMSCLRVPLAGAAARSGLLHDAVARSLPGGAGTQLLRAYISSLLQNIQALSPSQAEHAANGLFDLLALSLEGADPKHDDRAGVQAALYRRALAYIDAHLGEADLSLAHISAHLQLAPRTLQNLFQAHGTTFTACLLEHRLMAAERLISNDSRTLMAQVAYAVGFSDQSYFNRAFRRRFGMTPTERRHEAARLLS
ncbi:AraC family transcriptional regulator [Pusillimonas sp. CC-YST705]|uniref:AraC family transcriptional regulator n=1 Tax=Mesopusillimonas faecipullorum TaxID=2755040 RepID=A0ABS8CE75_9BURK|nr:AraC family transcriptional regulator [Mesopusillimonas faecipullorum]MCB5364334.1 AraC family transcriptional regulator [Mesopusillimonas faecipullorum]